MTGLCYHNLQFHSRQVAVRASLFPDLGSVGPPELISSIKQIHHLHNSHFLKVPLLPSLIQTVILLQWLD